MLRKRIVQGLALLAFLPLLTSCSYTFDVRAIAIDGYVAFVVAPGSSVSSDCVTNIVVATDGPNAASGSKDDTALVAQGVYRWQSVVHEDGCKNPFPIFYSRPLKGRQRDPSSEVTPKPLRLGIVYEVSITAGATGYGAGHFRLRTDRTIENLPRQ